MTEYDGNVSNVVIYPRELSAEEVKRDFERQTKLSSKDWMVTEHTNWPYGQ